MDEMKRHRAQLSLSFPSRFFSLFSAVQSEAQVTINTACNFTCTMRRVYRKQMRFGIRESLMRLRRNDKSSYVRKLYAQNFRRKFIPFVIVVSRRPWNDNRYYIFYIFMQCADINIATHATTIIILVVKKEKEIIFEGGR